MRLRDLNKKFDFLLFGAVVLIVITGCFMIYSGGFDPIDRINSGLFKRQILWLVVGSVIMTGASLLNYQRLAENAHYIYGFLLVILLLTTLFGSTIRNSRAWINLYFFSIQPSEFMKLGTVIMLAKILELKERDIHHFRELLLPSAVVMIPVVVILLQPDFGTAMIFIPILFAMLFTGGADVKHLISIILIASIALFLPMALTYSEWIGAGNSGFLMDLMRNTRAILIGAGIMLGIAVLSFLIFKMNGKKFLQKIYIPCSVVSLGLIFSLIIHNFFKLYQKKRILVFLNPELDPQGAGYNIIQSKIAIGSGGLTGKGFLEGSQSQLGFLPEKTSDFVFSVVAEEWGFLGALVLILLLAFVVFRGIQTALHTRDKFGALLAIGITSVFFFHILINIGMVIGIMPVTGLPLCFVSYGGSNLLMCMIGAGILSNIRSRRFSAYSDEG